MDQEAVRRELTACLLSDEEMAAGHEAWNTYDNPFEELVNPHAEEEDEDSDDSDDSGYGEDDGEVEFDSDEEEDDGEDDDGDESNSEGEEEAKGGEDGHVHSASCSHGEHGHDHGPPPKTILRIVRKGRSGVGEGPSTTATSDPPVADAAPSGV